MRKILVALMVIGIVALGWALAPRRQLPEVQTVQIIGKPQPVVSGGKTVAWVSLVEYRQIVRVPRAKVQLRDTADPSARDVK